MTESLVTFATLEDLALRTGNTYEASEADRINALLSDASVMLVERGFDPSETDEYRLAAAKTVVCNMVARKLASDGMSDVYSQQTMSAGPYSQTYTFANAGEALYITRRELQSLRLIGGYRILQAHTWRDEL
mgnify:FL=1